ncbi:MAG: SDR family oxidoreductase [Clostridiales Family XIII bacterium]|jgi:2-deoxy-D-gluconate 3-dehydrogenase|nr:SDR family oxidoreductase [Clostridiales Family XIII bacterium]
MAQQVTDFSMDWFSLKGKVAIITGATRNLGLGYAVAFAKAGADLFIPVSTGNTETVQRLVEAEGRKVAFLRGDLADRSYIDEIVAGCLKEYGRIDILVNNAGTNHFADFDSFPDEEWKRVMDIDLNAVYYLGHEVGKVMKRQGSGKIINIGSALSFTADMKCPPYITAKHGVVGLTRHLSNELGKYGVQANCLCPGFIFTEINAGLMDDKALYDHITSRIAAGRWGDAADLMGTAVFLASRASDYMNGTTLNVDGGFATVL